MGIFRSFLLATMNRQHHGPANLAAMFERACPPAIGQVAGLCLHVVETVWPLRQNDGPVVVRPGPCPLAIRRADGLQECVSTLQMILQIEVPGTFPTLRIAMNSLCLALSAALAG